MSATPPHHPNPTPPSAAEAAPTLGVALPPGARVAVAMSGGVDSSVVAALLVEAGYDVFGLTARLYDVDRAEAAARRAGSCCAPEDARDARRVAASLDIPHYVLDERASFAAEVIAPFVEGWTSGQTPNPCVSCNRSLKFDRLVERARSLGAVALATGHYARLEPDARGRPALRRGRDERKDQAYFLYPLPHAVAGFLRFPLGAMTKAEVRAHAARLGVPTAEKPESQDICFVGAKTAGDWLESQTDAPQASLVALDGTMLGKRGSLARFTVGQRRGLGLPPDASGAPRFVVDKQPDGTVLIGRREELAVATLTLGRLNAPAEDWPAVGERVALQTRHRGSAVRARVTAHDGDRMTLAIEGLLEGAARGQHGVVFDGDAVRCGGVIVETVRRDAA